MTRTKTTTTTNAVPEPATQAEISVYQQLRHHLAVLKLHAAAEALPGMLERAQGEGWSMTSTLEQLLAVEVEENQARRLAGRLRFASLPTPATLDGFDYDAAPGVDRQLIAELAEELRATAWWHDEWSDAIIGGAKPLSRACSVPCNRSASEWIISTRCSTVPTAWPAWPITIVSGCWRYVRAIRSTVSGIVAEYSIVVRCAGRQSRIACSASS